MRIEKFQGEGDRIILNNQKDVKIMEFIEKSIIEQIEGVPGLSKKAVEIACSCVSDVLDPEGYGILEAYEKLLFEREEKKNAEIK